MSFTEEEIHNLYVTKVKLPPHYFQKYEILPPCPIKSRGYQWNKNDFPRNWCVLDFIEWTQKHASTINSLGYTCETDDELEFISAKEKTLLSYPKHDLHRLPKELEGKFDFFIFNQTIEHLYNPFEAVKQIYSTIKPGGYVFTSVPTLNIPHMTPIHFNGFTPMGLAMLFKTASFEVVEIGQWGNLEYIQRLWHTHNWPGYDDLQHNNSVTNEERNVCQTWILARRPV